MDNFLSEFKHNGYVIEKNVFSNKDFEEIFIIFYDLAISCILRNSSPINLRDYPKLSEVVYPRDLKFLDKLLLEIMKKDRSLIGEIYDTLSFSSGFLRFISNKKIEISTKRLLEIEAKTTLYGWENRVRIDPPNDNARTYGWHQEVFYTQPRFRYLQTWAPIMRDTTLNNGTIHIKPRSHNEGIAKQTWNQREGRAEQILIDEEILNKYETKIIEMKKGDVLYFSGYLAHSSGNNITEDEIRYSLVGMWNDTSIKEFRAPLPKFLSRNESRKEYFINTFGSERFRTIKE